MGFADRMDQNVAKYKIGIRMNAWMVDIVPHNVQVLCRINKDECYESLSFLAFRRENVDWIFQKYSKKSRSSLSRSVRNVALDVCYDDTEDYQAPPGK